VSFVVEYIHATDKSCDVWYRFALIYSKLKQKYVNNHDYLSTKRAERAHRVQFAEQSGLLCQNYATKRETFHNI
jgi:hypothetical protein